MIQPSIGGAITAFSMANCSIDLPLLNREILLHPAEAGTHELVALLEMEKPGLEFLCPLARAIYWMETGRAEQIDALEALGTLWFIDDSDARGDGEVCFEESARHSIDLILGETAITLGFESHAQLFFSGDFWPEGLRARNAITYDVDARQDSAFILKDLFLAFDADRSGRRTRANPNDSECVGECRYTLAFVNDMPVNGPSFTNSYHEQSWEGLNEKYPQRWNHVGAGDYDLDNSAFCWLHYLTPEQAERLGIASQGDQAIGPGQGYPEWVSKQIAAQSDAIWIHSDCIQASYTKASVIVEPTHDFWFAVGCGTNWDPANPASQLDAETVHDWDEFPKNAEPLIRIKISRNMSRPPAALEALLPYWHQLLALV